MATSVPARRVSVLVTTLLQHMADHGEPLSDWSVRLIIKPPEMTGATAADLVVEAYSARDALDVALTLARRGCQYDAGNDDATALFVWIHPGGAGQAPGFGATGASIGAGAR